MKIVMTTDPSGSIWTYSLDLIKALSKYDVHVMLATLGGLPSTLQMKEALSLPNLSLRCSSFKCEWKDDPWNDLDNAQLWISQLVHDFKPDIIHFNNMLFNGSPYKIPIVMVGHSCALSWWNAVKSSGSPPEWQRYTQLVKIGLQSADVVVAPSMAMLDSLKYFYGPLKSGSVIYHGRDNAHLHFGPKNNIIFSIGRIWDEAKNIQLLLDAAKSTEYPIFIAGETKTITEAEHLSINVFLLGKQTSEEIATWLSKTKIFVAPAQYEPFSLSVLEAAYSGCVLILSRIPSMQEIWKDNALYFNNRSVQELIQLINKVMDDDNLSQSFASKALRKAMDYSVSTMGDSYYNLYNSLTKDTKPTMTRQKETIPINHDNQHHLP